MAGLRGLIIGNSLANLIAGLSKAVFDFAVPALIARAVSTSEFSQWSLILQISAYVYVFGIGIQTALAKFIASPDLRNKENCRSATLNSAVFILVSTTIVAVLFVGGLVSVFPIVFSSIPVDDYFDFRVLCAMVGVSASLQIIGLLPTGVFMGMHQNIFFVVPLVFGRMLTLFFLWLACENNLGVIVIASIYSVGGVIYLPLLFFLMFYIHPWTKVRFWKKPNVARIKQILKYCGELSISMLSVLMITATSILVVGYFDFEKSGQFSIAITASSIIGGVLNSIMSPLVPYVSKINNESPESVPPLLEKATFYVMILLIFMLLLSVVYGYQIVDIWVGEAYVQATYPLVMIVFLANLVRFSMLPYCAFLLSTAQHGKAVYSAIGEAFANLSASVILASYFGAIGAAWGTVVGGSVGLLIHVMYNFNKTPCLIPSKSRYLIFGVLRPLAFSSPFIVLAVYAKI